MNGANNSYANNAKLPKAHIHVSCVCRGQQYHQEQMIDHVQSKEGLTGEGRASKAERHTQRPRRGLKPGRWYHYDLNKSGKPFLVGGWVGLDDQR
jgi:hypothetical protein